MSVFLFRVKSSTFERAQAKDGKHFVLHVKPDPQLDSCSAGDIAIICTEINKSAPACFALSAVNRNVPLRYTATITKHDPSRKDSHLLRFPNEMEQYKNLSQSNTNVFSKADSTPVSPAILSSKDCEGLEVIVEKPQYSLQVETETCNLLLDGELVIESDSEDTQIYRKIEDEQYVSAIQHLIAQKERPEPTPGPLAPSPSSTQTDTANPSPAPQLDIPAPTPQTSQPPITPQVPITTQTQNPQTLPPPISPHNAQTAQSSRPQTPQTPPTPPHTTAPPPPPASSKPKPGKKNVHVPNQSRAANGHAQDKKEVTPHGEKRENSDSTEPKDPKRAKPNPSTPSSPADIKPIDLLLHVTNVAGMLKELDAEHSERLSRLEEEVARLKARLGSTSTVPNTPIPSPTQSPSITKESPPNTSAARKRGRPRSDESPETPPLPTNPSTPTLPQISTPVFQQKVQKLSDLHFSAGEFIAVRVDPSSSNDGYWMARVIPGTPKQGLVRVKWFEKYAPLTGWYFMDTREDLVDPLSIFHRNFELVVKPWKNRSGNFIDIFRPLEDLSSFDNEK